MIGRIEGRLLEKNPPQVLVDVHGVGYEIDVPMSTLYNLPEIGANVVLWTYLVVREDAELLYGFQNVAERSLFKLLIRISGIGPKIALSILSSMNAQALAQAVESGEPGLLTRVPGIGKKTAERLILELKGKLDVTLTGAGVDHTISSAKADVVSALVALGYSEKEARLAIRSLPEDIGVSDGIREALKAFSK